MQKRTESSTSLTGSTVSPGKLNVSPSASVSSFNSHSSQGSATSSGTMVKLGRLKKKSFWSSWKEGFFTVDQSPYLMEFKSDTASKPHKVIPLGQYVIRLAHSITGLPHTFALFSAKPGKDPLFFLGQDEADVIEWISAMRQHTQPAPMEWESDTMLEALNDAVVVASDKGYIINVNVACLEMFGYPSRDTLIGKPITIFMPSSISEHHGQYMANYFETGKRRLIGIPRTLPAIKADGTVIDIVLSLGEQEGQKRFIATMRAADKLKSAEKSTLESVHSSVDNILLRTHKEMKETLTRELEKINMVFEEYRQKNNDLQVKLNRLEKEAKMVTFEGATHDDNNNDDDNTCGKHRNHPYPLPHPHPPHQHVHSNNNHANAVLQRRASRAKRGVEVDIEHIQICEKLSDTPGGSGAIVYNCVVDGWGCAMKEFSIDDVDSSLVDGILTEISLLESLPYHRNLVRYLFHQRTEHKVRLFMTKYATNLTSIIKRRRKEELPFSERELITMVTDIVKGIGILHQHNIMHRDLKSDNIFVTLNQSSEVECLSIGDFDTAKMISNVNIAKTVIGTPGYIAPEILKSKNKTEYTFAVDVWSLGMIIYELITLKRPFEDNSVLDIPRLTENGYLPEIPQDLQDRYKNMMTLYHQCLSVLPENRPSIKECKEYLAQL